MSLSAKQFGKAHAKLMGPEGGFSIKASSGKKPRTGYMVSIPGTEQQIRSENVAPAHIKEFMEKHADQLKEPDRYVGGWRNRETGEVSLDVSQNIKPNPKVKREHGSRVANGEARERAMTMAEGRNQEAGFDVKRKKDVPNPHFKAEPGRRSSG